MWGLQPHYLGAWTLGVPRLDLCGLRVSLISDRAPVFLCVFALSRPGGCKVWVGFGSRPLVFSRLSLDWRPASLEPLGPV